MRSLLLTLLALLVLPLCGGQLAAHDDVLFVAWGDEAPAIASEETPAEPAPAPAPAAEEPPKSEADKKVEAGAAWFGTYTSPEKETAESPASIINNGDNAWMLVCSALVLLMTGPGLALFYGGLVRQKNVLGTLMQSFAMMAVVTVIWTVCGFAIAFGDGGAYWGGLNEFVMLKGVFVDEALYTHSNRFPINLDYAPTINLGVFCVFQLMFAIITPALICGAYAERMKFAGMLLFSTLWLLIVYLPLAHMVWGKGGLFNWGFGAKEWAAFDFAGGTVVHISSGIAALMCAIFLGKRIGYPKTPMLPHNLVLSFIGACLLWVGWFGFNAGSALGANGLAALAFGNTQIAAAAAALGWATLEWLLRGKPTGLGAITGAVAGLVAITPAAGFVEPGSALVIGLIGGAICFVASVFLKSKLGYDDALDAFGVHGVGGMWGAVATGLFFAKDVNPNIPALNADLYRAIDAGTHPLIWNQIQAVLITVALSAVASAVILGLLKAVGLLRLTQDEEERGLDLSQHGEEAYAL